MKKFCLSFSTQNAAFDPDPVPEIARILRELANKIERQKPTGLYESLRDINGNVVGTFKGFPDSGPFSEG